MSIAVDSTEAPATLRFTVDGPWPTLAEQRRVWKPLIKGGLLTADSRALIDIRLVDNTPHYEEVQQLIDAAAQRWHWPLFQGFLVKSPSQFGLVRQMQAMSPGTVEIHIFTAKAVDWLNGRPENA